MAITFKRWDMSNLTDQEMSEATEQTYLELFRAESESYIREAQSLTAHESGLYWTESDEIIENAAREAAKKREAINSRIFTPLNTLNASVIRHKPLTSELVEERKAAMLEAVAIYRDAQHKFAGTIGEEYARRVDELERKANELSIYSGSFDISRYR